MKKLCMICNLLDESGSPTCLACGEATWTVTEEAPEPPPAEEPKKKVKK